MSRIRFAMEERRIAHAAELFEVLRDPELYEFLDEAPPQSIEELARKLARSESRVSPDGKEHWLNWIVRAESGEIAGYVQATVEETKETNVAYVFASKFQGQGLASESVKQMLAFVVARHHATPLFIVTEAANLASVRLASRLGFTTAPQAYSAKRGAKPNEIVLWLLTLPGTA